MKYLSIVVLLALIVSSVNAQSIENKILSKKEKKIVRKERKAQRLIEEEKVRLKMLEALNDRDFTLRANTFVGSNNQFQNVSDINNFLMIDGDQLIIHQNADIGQIYSTFQSLNFSGKISKFDVENRGEGKPLEVKIFVNNPQLARSMIIFMQAFAENLEARFFYGSNRYTMRGRYEKTSESHLYVYPTLVPTMGLKN